MFLFYQVCFLIINKIPEIINYVNNDLINFINLKLNTKISQDLIFIDPNTISYKEIIKNHPALIQKVTVNSFHAFEKIIFIFLYPIILFFCIKNYEIIIYYFSKLFSKEQKNFLKPIVDDILVSLSKYIRGQTIVIFIMTLYYCIITFALKGSIFIGLLSGILLFIPWLGMLTGLCLSIIYCLTNNGADFTFYSILIIYGVGYILEHWIIIPYFIGNSLGIPPIIIILSILVLAYSFGIIGVVLSLPLTAIISVLIKHFYRIYTEQQNN